MDSPKFSNPQIDGATASITSEKLWDVEKVARYLGLEPNTVREMARNKALPGIKVTRFWRFRPKDIESWLEARSA